MNDGQDNPLTILQTVIEPWLRGLVREEIEKSFKAIQDNKKAPPGLLTVEELAQALKVPKSWIYDRTRRKRDGIPHLRVGKYPRFELPRVLAWLESQNKN